MRRFLLILIFSSTLFGNSFDSGNLNFSKKEYSQAEKYYLEDIKSGESFSTYYNLSTLSYLNQKEGYGKYYLLKARDISPRDKDLIRLSKDKGISRSIISFRESVTLLAILTLLLAMVFLNNTLSKVINTPKVKPSLCAISIPLFALLLVISIINYNGDNAVVLKESTPLISPYIDSDKSFSLPEGEVVKVIDSFNSFYKIDYKNQLGWIHMDELGLLWND